SLAMQPKVMLFDEVTSALDRELVKEVLQVMKELAEDGMTMVVVTHELWFARNVANRIFFLDHGLVVEDGPEDKIFSAAHEARTRPFLGDLLLARCSFRSSRTPSAGTCWCRTSRPLLRRSSSRSRCPSSPSWSGSY